MKVWRISIIAATKKGTTIRDVADKGKTYYAKFKYERNKKGKWSMTHDYEQEQTYSGIATNIQKAIALALKCAKKDGLKNPEIIGIARFGNCDFGLRQKPKSTHKRKTK